MESLSAFAEAVQASPFGMWAAQSPLAYPIANVVHLFGIFMLIGGIGILDLRLAGAFRAIPLAPLSRALMPIALAGLALIVPSGAVMFAADAEALVFSLTFRWKLLLIAVALVNALAFRIAWQNRLDGWDREPPPIGRLMAGASVLLWLTVAALGRWIAYS
ncbi:MAG: hypothetical protein M3428_05110 [Pseudomonadota bacterium]|nr:hypothetical protein [Pseudomonadota bacterium]